MAVMKLQKSPTIRRLPTYLYKLTEMHKAGVAIVATPELARYMNLAEIVIRKDLAITGVTGQPGVGYRVAELIDAITRFLKWDRPAEAVLAGAGSLGHALLGYEGFAGYGLRIVAAFDADPAKIGVQAHGREILDIALLPEWLKDHPVSMGIICVPADCAQSVADLMVQGGVRGIWNFANVSLKVPENVVVQREVIAGGLAVLSVKLDRMGEKDAEKEKNL
ncbi:MAG: redox-sensing transcriptional repressor Rex [Lentisphaeria bacterium]|nr:redox-sensing transcriptional repressor Rex [Lentisphaeria bacterium]